MFDAGDSGIDNGANVSKTVVPNAAHRTGGLVTDYSLDIAPLTLSAGTYWLSIVGNLTLPSPHPDDFPADPNKHLDPTWSWVTADRGDNLAYQFDQRFDPFEPGFRLTSGCPGRCDTTFTLLGIPPSSGVPGDYDGNSILSAVDLDILAGAIRDGSTDTAFDLDDDGNISNSDFDFWLSDLFGTLVGDADLNHQVDIEDFLDLSRGFGQAGGWGNGDFNGDGTVLFNDFVDFARNFGLSHPSSVSAQNVVSHVVPEPSRWLQFATMVLVFPFMRIVKRIRK